MLTTVREKYDINDSYYLKTKKYSVEIEHEKLVVENVLQTNKNIAYIHINSELIADTVAVSICFAMFLRREPLSTRNRNVFNSHRSTNKYKSF